MGLSQSKRSIGTDCGRLEEWMTLLRKDIREHVPIIHLAIPGSHNSMTFKITRKSKLAPDAEKVVQRVYKCLPWFIAKWAKTQSYTTTDQLKFGIRFFDLRISQKETTDIEDRYYIVHGLFSTPMESEMREIKTFLDQHPGELVILDFQHFYEISCDDHDIIHTFLTNLFGDKILTMNDGPLTELTLDKAYKLRKQLLIVYRSAYNSIYYWPGAYFPTPWPNTAKLKVLKEFLVKSLQNRSMDYGWITQCVLTPDSKYIVLRPRSNLELTAKKVWNYLDDWIKAQTPGSLDNGSTECVNILIADFVNIKNSSFISTVVDLNNKIPYQDAPAERIQKDSKIYPDKEKLLNGIIEEYLPY
ncbi:unnamed protein product [Hermetia illucens]|uniref:Phosphatidylinositol-specific phospholipase C X domain-containing protein n=2 Tax=Hermetia illucens TaxID=343691 RepID=A0A7R8UDT6_HERIL|nr:PI-PLC X domain-containing protein 3 isoform X3 [Hermetia illucens]XP_037905422.1 PI-PLC X domain-containing protein 3 isoform X3 [Hermetia illucens]XP_037905432.1 PI-PLC X domain-containing protein 3 isoform X3 [Hermetia illucens]XP_037905440.1 PI-PLC X domain-containing protein 3 isoform X3 [Hermetia illucens]XP_037905448.1 PI-PLC X domain-containing protein 3 isoform X3 [Hermetia illucens]XP_037905455.1 PI-PLC X domain-containing protein 3 isoform X3 [Hermetia illucens]XP_037905464.1 PI